MPDSEFQTIQICPEVVTERFTRTQQDFYQFALSVQLRGKTKGLLSRKTQHFFLYYIVVVKRSCQGPPSITITQSTQLRLWAASVSRFDPFVSVWLQLFLSCLSTLRWRSAVRMRSVTRSSALTYPAPSAAMQELWLRYSPMVLISSLCTQRFPDETETFLRIIFSIQRGIFTLLEPGVRIRITASAGGGITSAGCCYIKETKLPHKTGSVERKPFSPGMWDVTWDVSNLVECAFKQIASFLIYLFPFEIKEAVSRMLESDKSPVICLQVYL